MKKLIAAVFVCSQLAYGADQNQPSVPRLVKMFERLNKTVKETQRVLDVFKANE